MTDTIKTAWVRMSHRTPEHMAQEYGVYFAYGSNLWLTQMAERCSDADIIGTARLRGARLAFARVATIVQDENVDVLGALYTVSANDIASLDRKEGLGRAYDRFLVTVESGDTAYRAITYIKREDIPQAPTDEYFAKLTAGYRDWKLPDRRLRRARERAVKEQAALPKAKPKNDYWNYEPWGNGPSRPHRHPAPKSSNRTSLVTGRNLDREPRLFERDETIGKYLERHERDPGIAEQITRDGGQTSFHNQSTGEHWAKSGGVWRRVKQ